MGIVYFADDTKLNRHVAVKRLEVDAPDSKLTHRRYLEEARDIVTLGHYHIVSIYDVGQDRRGNYVSIGYIAGPDILPSDSNEDPLPPVTLGQYVELKGSMRPNAPKSMILKLCWALDYAHNQGSSIAM
jgi:serine/threonine protein kinase